MFSRLWTVLSLGLTAWTIKSKLEQIQTDGPNIYAEFFLTLSPEEQAIWVKNFGRPRIAQSEDLVMPNVYVPPKSSVAPIEQLVAQT